jgi:hypothetical protein
MFKISILLFCYNSNINSNINLAEALLSSAFKTQSLSQTMSTRAPSLCMVGCPQNLGSSFDEGEKLRLNLRKKGIIIQKLYPIFGDRLYLRISAAVYNTVRY